VPVGVLGEDQLVDQPGKDERQGNIYRGEAEDTESVHTLPRLAEEISIFA